MTVKLCADLYKTSLLSVLGVDTKTLQSEGYRNNTSQTTEMPQLQSFMCEFEQTRCLQCHAQRNVKYESKWQWHCTTLLMAWYEWLLTGYSWHQFEGSEYPNGSQSTEVHVHIITKRKLCNEPVEAITSYHYHKLLLIYEYIRSSSQLG